MRIVLEIKTSKFGPDVDIQPDSEVMMLPKDDHEAMVDEIVRAMEHYRIFNADQTGA